MSNELLFILQMIVSLSFVLCLFRLGKEYLIGYIGLRAVILSQIFVNKQFDLFGLASGGNVMYGLYS